MDHLNTRTDLVNFIHKYAPFAAIRRACYTGTVNVLGGFSIVPPGTEPGWITIITSVYGRTWFVVVGPHPAGLPMYVIRTVKRIPWRYWVGDHRANNPIFNGDNPDRARLLREVAENE